MGAIPAIVPISELRQDAAGVIKKTRSTQEPVFITQRGKATAVLVSAQSYEQTQYELELLKVLAKGETEIKEGKGIPLEEVFRKADELLRSDK